MFLVSERKYIVNYPITFNKCQNTKAKYKGSLWINIIRFDYPSVLKNFEISSENLHKNPAECRSTAVKFTFRSDSFKCIHLQFDFQHSFCLQTTK